MGGWASSKAVGDGLAAGGVRGGLDQPALLRSREHELEHHVVGEQDVGRVGQDLLEPLVALLAGVAGEADEWAVKNPARCICALLELAVGERVHRVDDDRLDPSPALSARAQDVVDDRNDVAQAFAGAGARGEDVVVTGPRGVDAFDLVAVQPQRLELDEAAHVAGVVADDLGAELEDVHEAVPVPGAGLPQDRPILPADVPRWR